MRERWENPWKIGYDLRSGRSLPQHKTIAYIAASIAIISPTHQAVLKGMPPFFEMTMTMLARPNISHHMDVPNIMREMAVKVDRSPGLASYKEGL